MTRLVIDARLAGHSGIGTYRREMLPRVTAGLSAWRPVVLSQPAQLAALEAQAGGRVELRPWAATPLSVADLWSVPPGAGPRDLLWTPHFNVPLRGAGALAVTLHDLLPLTAPALAGTGRSWPLRLWLRSIRRRARAVFCISEFTRAEALRHGALDPARMHVTPLGVDAAWFGAAGVEASALRATMPPTMIFVGLLKPHKNVLRLLRAFAQVRDRIPHRLVLVARHEGLRNFDREALALAAAHADRVELVQDLPFSELLARVASAQFAVQPSLHAGVGLPALEAMAAGVPVLAARAAAMPEVCGDAVLYCDPVSENDIAARLLELAGDPALRARLALAGQARARAFSWDRCAEETATGLEAALAALSRTAPSR
jgi:glycosyltransferase involved in cell wall biosynthesis